jgi:hypothetical protein
MDLPTSWHSKMMFVGELKLSAFIMLLISSSQIVTTNRDIHEQAGVHFHSTLGMPLASA